VGALPTEAESFFCTSKQNSAFLRRYLAGVDKTPICSKKIEVTICQMTSSLPR